MSNYLDAYKARTNAHGSNIRERIIYEQKMLIDSSFSDSPSYYEIRVDDSTGSIGVRILDDSDIKDQKIILLKPGVVLNGGSTITWNGEKWLTTHVDNVGDIHYRGIIQKCASSIKWLDNNRIKEAFFTYSSTFSGLGINNGQIISLPNEQRYIVVPNNIDTQKFKKDNRFIIDQMAWKVTAIDRVRQSNLIYLTLLEDAIQPNDDNLELRIANYYSNHHTYTVTITNGEAVNIPKDSTLQLNVQATDNDQVMTNPVLSFVSSNEATGTVDSNGLVTGMENGTVTITVVLSNDISVIDTIAVTVETVIVDHYSISITSTATTPNEIKYNQSKSYSAQITNNGTLVTEAAVFSLYADDQSSSTTKALISTQDGTNCTVKNNETQDNSYVWLKAEMQRDSTVVSWLRIQLKPLL